MEQSPFDYTVVIKSTFGGGGEGYLFKRGYHHRSWGAFPILDNFGSRTRQVLERMDQTFCLRGKVPSVGRVR